MTTKPANAANIQRGRNRFLQPPQLDFFVSDEQRALWKKLEFFPSPPPAFRALLEQCQYEIVEQEGVVYEPCAGRGHGVEPLRAARLTVYPSDIHDHGAGYDIADALTLTPRHTPAFTKMITNPPFSGPDYNTSKPTLAERIVRHWQAHADHVFVLQQLGFLVTGKRYALMHDNPIGNLKTFMPFYDRIPMQLGFYNPDGSTATEYAWYHFERGFTGTFDTKPIPPGTFRRLMRKEDLLI